MFVGSRLVCLVGFWLRMFGRKFADKFHRGSLWFCWFGLVRNETLQSLNPKDRERESHPCVNLHQER